MTFLRHIIEIGEIEEISIENGRLWKAYWMPYHQVWCNIIIFDNGDIYVEGYSNDGRVMNIIRTPRMQRCLI